MTVPVNETSKSIMERLRREADGQPRPGKRHATLDRLEEACEAILSGEAAKTADLAGADALPFRVRPPTLNSETIDRYVKIRRRLDGDKQWPGPTGPFIRSDAGLKAYIAVREAEARGGRRRTRPPPSRRAVDEILSRIPDPMDRLTVFEDRSRLQHEVERLRIAVNAIKQISGFDVDQLISAKAGGRIHVAEVATPLQERQRRIIGDLIERLTNPSELAPFGLTTDGVRVRMAFGPMASLVKKEELVLLRELAGYFGDSRNPQSKA
jgi:hypothetical protein